MFGLGKKHKYETTVVVKDLQCAHCEAAVRVSLLEVEGINDAKVSKRDEQAIIYSDQPLDEERIKDAIEKVGYTYGGLK